MKRILLIVPLLVFAFSLALPAAAQSDMIIKQRAKDIRDANNAQQGVPPTASPARPAAPAAPATPAPAPAPTLTPAQQAALATQQKNIDQLTADLAAIKAGSTVSADQKLSLEKNLLATATSGTKPSKQSLTKLVEDLSTALSAKDIPARERGQLARAIGGVVNSGSGTVTPAQAQASVTAAQNALKSGGVGEAETKTITDDLKAIVAELQKNRPRLYQ